MSMKQVMHQNISTENGFITNKDRIKEFTLMMVMSFMHPRINILTLKHTTLIVYLLQEFYNFQITLFFGSIYILLTLFYSASCIFFDF